MILQIRVEITGNVPDYGRNVFLSNHLSYLDLPVLGGVFYGSFVAREDVVSWPFFGQLALLQTSIFISRRSANVKQDTEKLDKALAEGRPLVIFPEGTSTDGRSVKPLKSSLFSVFTNARDRGFSLIPVTLELIEVAGLPPDAQNIRDLYAWHGDMLLVPHLWAFLRLSGATLRLSVHPAIDHDVSSRKELAKITHDTIASGLNTSVIKPTRGVKTMSLKSEATLKTPSRL